jgi:hypothetical protein
MPNHKTSLSLTSFWEHLIYTEGALEAVPEVAHLVGPVTAQQGGFKALHDEELEAARATRKVEALVAVANLVLDGALTQTHNALLGEVQQDRTAAAFVRMFPEPISVQIRYGLEQQIKILTAARRQLTDSKDLYSAAFIKTHSASLKAAIAQGDAALEARRAHEIKLADLRLRLEDWKQDTNAVLTAVEGELKTHGANNKKGAKWHKAFLG